MKLLYKMWHSVLPCVLLTLCIGFCYAFSLFVPPISELMGCSKLEVQFTFCLNIFFLGMGAACFGPLAEKNIKMSALTSTILLSLGLALSGLACRFHNLWLLYLGSGVCCGISEGCGYVTPNKNMLLWFSQSKFKGLLMAVSIFTFGFGSSLCSYMFGHLYPNLGIENTFYALSVIYAIPMAIGVFAINKPRYALLKIAKRVDTGFRYVETLKDNYFLKCWLFMFINISMGLILIGGCASTMTTLGFTASEVITIMMLCGVFNATGRLVFPAIGDFLKNRSFVWVITAVFEVLLMIPVIWSIGPIYVAAACLVLIHCGYGSAFACLPSILSTHYGKDNLSQLHGFCLTSWGMASLMAFLCSTFVLKFFPGMVYVMILVAIGYVINIFVSMSIAKQGR